MSRIAPTIIKKAAQRIDPYLSLLLKEAGTIKAARNELRWLKEHVESSKTLDCNYIAPQKPPHDPLLELCKRRSKSEPLQYILGSQPFGELDILCEPGVLIPRPETEAYTTYLASKICNGLLETHLKASRAKTQSSTSHAVPGLRILDACSGSGCISLLLYKLLSKHLKSFGGLEIDGLDISPEALRLSRKNKEHNIAQKHLIPEALDKVHFLHSNLLLRQQTKSLKPYDIIISNPPYISREEFDTKLPSSVRDWEPGLALVPSFAPGADEHFSGNPADIFYEVLLEIYQTGIHKPLMLVMEIGDEAQARRVLALGMTRYQIMKDNDVSVWRDWPDVRPSGKELLVMEGRVSTEGQGNLRTIVLTRKISEHGDLEHRPIVAQHKGSNQY